MEIFKKSFKKEDYTDKQMNDEIARIVKHLQENPSYQNNFASLNPEEYSKFLTKVNEYN